MSLNISNEKSTIPFGIYRIDKKCLEHFQSQNPDLFNPEQTLYCGPVLTDYSEKHNKYIDFFVPIIENTETLNQYAFNGTTDAVINGVFGELDFNKMIPCTKRFLTADKNETERLNFYIKEQEMIKTLAKQIHQ